MPRSLKMVTSAALKISSLWRLTLRMSLYGPSAVALALVDTWSHGHMASGHKRVEHILGWEARSKSLVSPRRLGKFSESPICLENQ